MLLNGNSVSKWGLPLMWTTPHIKQIKVSLETFRVENENENENVPCMVNVHVYGKPTIAADRTYELLYDSLADASSASTPQPRG